MGSGGADRPIIVGTERLRGVADAAGATQSLGHPCMGIPRGPRPESGLARLFPRGPGPGDLGVQTIKQIAEIGVSHWNTSPARSQIRGCREAEVRNESGSTSR